jgi:nickel-dependent lactate racemase
MVTSQAGRDRGQIFVVLAVEDEDGHYARVADGRARPVARAKRKNIRHLQAHTAVDAGLAACVARGGVPTDAEVREAVAAFARAEQPGADAGGWEAGL